MWIELETIHLNEINFSVRYLCMLCYILHSFPLFIFLPFSNEREGIPANLLQMLDVCVEIPQQGIIRSLNVHVSAALLIWEYTRQHLSSGSAEVDSKRSWWRHLMLTSLADLLRKVFPGETLNEGVKLLHIMTSRAFCRDSVVRSHRRCSQALMRVMNKDQPWLLCLNVPLCLLSY